MISLRSSLALAGSVNMGLGLNFKNDILFSFAS